MAPDRWPLRNSLILGALPTAVPCARLHTRHVLGEWGLKHLAERAELIVSELVTNAVHATARDGGLMPVRLRLLADLARLLILVWDASLKPPVRVDVDGDAEAGRGLMVVEAISSEWGFCFPPQPRGGKIVWALIEAEG